MLAKLKIYKSKDLARRLRAIGTAAQLALVAAILLGRLDIPNFDFFEGILIGFALVGNLAFLASLRLQKEQNDV